MWVACMKREMKLMIVSGYQLYKLYRLIKYEQFIVFLRIEQLIGVVGHLVFWIKYEQSHVSLWPLDNCGQELSWADTGSEARDRPPDGSPSYQHKSWTAKNFINRGTKKTPAPPSSATKNWIQELLLPQASAWRQASHQGSEGGRRCRRPRPPSPRRRRHPRPSSPRRCRRPARGGATAPLAEVKPPPPEEVKRLKPPRRKVVQQPVVPPRALKVNVEDASFQWRCSTRLS
jgi:hypothetical protein